VKKEDVPFRTSPKGGFSQNWAPEKRPQRVQKPPVNPIQNALKNALF